MRMMTTMTKMRRSSKIVEVGGPLQRLAVVAQASPLSVTSTWFSKFYLIISSQSILFCHLGPNILVRRKSMHVDVHVENTQVEEQSWELIQILASTSPLLRKDMVMIDVQIVREDFGLFPLIINPTGIICLIPEAGVESKGCVNKNSYSYVLCILTLIIPAERAARVFLLL